MKKIELKNVYKKYDNAEDYSVKDFNLEIEDGEFIVFVGPSGCGKSTTLRMIAGLLSITEGEIWINDVLVNKVAPKDRDIAMVFQNYALYPHMTVRENIAFGLKLRKYKKEDINSRVKEAAEILGLTDYINRKPADLSGGQRQRVALGRAIVRDTNIFLMDEPLSNLDAKLRVQMRTEIAKLHEKLKSTIIYVTHDQTEAMTMADRIVIMKDGIVQQIGTPIEVYDYPKNIFVAGFIGSPAMNFFKVTYNDGYITNEDDIKIKVTKQQEEMLENKGYNDKELIFGIRPEDVHLDQNDLEFTQDVSIHAKMIMSELLGSDSMLYMETNNEDFVARVDVRDIYKPGDEEEFFLDMNKIHFFDVQNEMRIK
ncbi:ABC transporter ATP-binding protein [Helcococcus kunzii]|uniref:ABC transporter ATP-binding protein n=1 Tax=Helcococcus kunzii TaxID=40091 RepID=UPI0038B0B633